MVGILLLFLLFIIIIFVFLLFIIIFIVGILLLFWAIVGVWNKSTAGPFWDLKITLSLMFLMNAINENWN